jgi:hypothetical protein
MGTSNAYDEKVIQGPSAVLPSALSACAALPDRVHGTQMNLGSVRSSIVILRMLARGFGLPHALQIAPPSFSVM